MWLYPFSISQAAKEKRFFKLCYNGTADIGDFSSLLAQGVDTNIYDKVGATKINGNRQVCIEVMSCSVCVSVVLIPSGTSAIVGDKTWLNCSSSIVLILTWQQR